MKRSLLVFITLISLTSFSQDYEIGMNVVKNDLLNTSYAADSSAEAVIIYDYGNAYFNKNNWKLNVEFKRKIKILSKEGLNYGQLEIPLFIGANSRENIKDINVRIYNLDGGEVKVSTMEKDAVYREKNENWEIVRLVFPNVKVGSIITYSYTKTTSFVSKFQQWYFQHNIPTLYSEFNASIPGNYEYHIKLVGGLPLKENTSNIEYNCLVAGRGANANCAVYKYIMTDIPAYREEKFTTTRENYIAKIEYELSVVKQFTGQVKKITKSWSDVDDELKSDKDFGRLINRKNLVKHLLPAVITSITDDKEKAKAIYQYVLNNYKWNKKSGIYDSSIKRLLENKSGNAVEINLLLQNILHSEGFEAYPMLISTRQNGLATKVYPVLTDFNYVIVKLIIGEDTILIDATTPYLSFGELPIRCLNQYGRVFDVNYGSYWESTIPKNYSSTQIGVKYKLNENNQLTGTLNRGITGYSAHNYKKLFNENTTAYKEALKNEFNNSLVSSHKVLSKSIQDKRFVEQIELIHDEEFVGDKIYFNPFVYRFFNENPFKLELRTYPIDFGYKQAYLYSMEVDLGDKLKVMEIPGDSNFALPNKAGLVSVSFQNTGSKLTVFLRIKFDKAIYDAGYYDALKSFMSKIIELQNNSIIVLQKT
ncbi:MAG: DUF3857 domain-containing protein [Winogradskyella sp.]|uniref:DUF3857 domain-containing protein n=1 Tax=Winogradskyella sp. TaxID=1883156 RepID=UPI000F3FB189|nr:DUF3857 domain-containing protein [Winogradskyella sp.]RNC79806.1 MAG: DUF3857 domain-containing protein [Winogradskyella sp.]